MVQQTVFPFPCPRCDGALNTSTGECACGFRFSMPPDVFLNQMRSRPPDDDHLPLRLDPG